MPQDLLRVPVELAGIKKVQQELQQIFTEAQKGAGVTARMMEDAMRTSASAVSREMAKQGVTTPTQTMLRIEYPSQMVDAAGNVIRDAAGKAQLDTELIEEVTLGINTDIQKSMQEGLETFRREIGREMKQARTPAEAKKVAKRHSALLKEAEEGFAKGKVGAPFVERLRDEAVRFEKDVQKLTDDTKKSLENEKRRERLAATKKAELSAKRTMNKIGEYNLANLDQLRQAQDEMETLMLNLRGGVGKFTRTKKGTLTAGVSQEFFVKVQKTERALRHRLENAEENEANNYKANLKRQEQDYFKDRKRTLKAMYEGAGNNLAELSKVFDAQRRNLTDITASHKLGVFGTNTEVTEARRAMQKTAATMQDITISQMTRSQRYALMSPEEQRAEMDRRRQVHERALGKHDAMRGDAKNAFAQTMLGGASAGIGLFGQAGFPLLNIGFAAMSSPAAGVIAAVTTVVGETVRGLERLRNHLLQTADQVGFVTKHFKDMRSELEATKAFFGGIASVGESHVMEERMRLMRNNAGGLAYGTAVWQGISGYGRNAPYRLMKGDTSDLPIGPMTNLMLGPLAPFVGNAFRKGFGGAGQMQDEFAKNFDEMVASFSRKMLQFSASFEGGDQMFKRISQAAASRNDEERKRRIRYLEVLEEINQTLKETRGDTKKHADDSKAREEGWMDFLFTG